MNRFLLSSVAFFALCGCHALDGAGDAVASSTVGGLVVLDAVSVINTHKTLDDHLVSLITGKDCSSVRASMGDYYCIDQPGNVPTIVRTSYCYKTLGTIDCYTEPVEADAGQFYGIRVDDIPVTLH